MTIRPAAGAAPSAGRRLGAVLLSALALTAGKPPDITALYQPYVRNQDRNPVIVIPGLMGSRLEDRTTGVTVWGAFTRRSAKLKQPAGMRSIMLNVWQIADDFGPDDVAALDDRLVATGPLARLKVNALFAVLTVRVYSSILGALGAGGYVDQAFAGLDYGPEHFNCFTFFYDWRKDIVTNARALGAFIEKSRRQVEAGRRALGLPERDVKFDIVAHSLGSLIARYYLRYGPEDVVAEPPPAIPWRGATDIDRLILVAPPNLGSAEAIHQMLSGRDLGPFLPTLPPVLLAGIPSLYQLLPRESSGVLRGADGSARPVSFLDPSTWVDNGWGPFAPDQEPVLRRVFPAGTTAAERYERTRRFVAACLTRAKQVAAALDRFPQQRPPTEVTLFAGDSTPTLAHGIVREHDGRLELDFRKSNGTWLLAPGDGSVTRTSALGDLRVAGDGSPPWLISPVPWTASIFIGDDHLGLTENRHFQDNLLHILLERRPHWAAPQ